VAVEFCHLSIFNLSVLEFIIRLLCLDVFERTVKCRLTQAFVTYFSSHHFARFVIHRCSTQAFLTRQRYTSAQICCGYDGNSTNSL